MAVPIWRDVLEMCGMVRGTRDNVRGRTTARACGKPRFTLFPFLPILSRGPNPRWR